MRRYETIFIVDPDISEEIRNQLFTKSKELVASMGGFLALFDEWGAKKLAYDIKKKSRGYYVRMDFCGGADLVNELERSFRLDDKYLKFMTILLDSDADPEKIAAELDEAKKAEESTETATEATEEVKEAKEAEAETTETETAEEE